MSIPALLDQFIEVRDSGIHGKGIFTLVNIKQGVDISIIKGEVISEEECIKREEEENVYIFWNGDTYIDTINTEKIKYINHKCDSNCEVLDNDENTLILSALKDIKAGEELTIDYGYEEIYESCQCDECFT